MPDGTITFSTALDNAELEKQLNSLTKKVGSLEDRINQKQAERMPLVDQAKQLGAELDAAKAKLYEMQNASVGAFSSEEIKDQQIHVNGLQTEWNGVQGRVERYDTAISNATIELNRTQEKAGAVAGELAAAGDNTIIMDGAVNSANKHFALFKRMLERTIIRATSIIFIYKAIQGVFEYFSKVAKVTPEATSAIARLKAALLTMAQPLINVIIPAFTDFVNVLANVLTAIASFTSMLAGTSLEQSAASAKALNDETSALEGTGSAAKKASKSLASFDEINKLSSGSENSGSSSSAIAPDFSSIGNTNWLKGRLGESAGMVAAALLLGGIALIAIGAATGSTKAVIAGLLLIGSGVYVAEETGTLQSWYDTLGLNNVEEFKTTAVILGGIAAVAIGAAMGNILMVIAGLGLLGAAIAYSEKSGQMKSWSDTLEIDKAPSYITSALLLGGIALTSLGAMTGNTLMVLAGIGLLGSGVYVGYPTIK